MVMRRFQMIREPAPESKLGLPPKALAALTTENQPVSVMLKVTEADYIPAQVTLRARIGRVLLTADVLPSDLPQLAADPHVVSIEVSTPLRSQEA